MQSHASYATNKEGVAATAAAAVVMHYDFAAFMACIWWRAGKRCLRTLCTLQLLMRFLATVVRCWLLLLHLWGQMLCWSTAFVCCGHAHFHYIYTSLDCTACYTHKCVFYVSQQLQGKFSAGAPIATRLS